MERILLWIGIGLVALVVLVIIGLRIEPASFPRYPGAPGALEYVPLPAGLPAPVERFYHAVYGPEVATQGVPVITSAVITGRATLRIGPVKMPGRFRFTHVAGQDYRHYIETTFFGFPVFKVNETYIDGRGRQEIPFGVVDDVPTANRAAALGMWAEAGWFPALFVTDPRVRWAPVDAYTAVLYVPYQEGEEAFVTRFDPDTDLIYAFEAMRDREAASTRKVLWITEAREWGQVDGHMTMVNATVTWLDQGTPWAVFRTEEVVLNADVSEYVRQKGQ